MLSHPGPLSVRLRELVPEALARLLAHRRKARATEAAVPTACGCWRSPDA
jgi:hypothetical protein